MTPATRKRQQKPAPTAQAPATAEPRSHKTHNRRGQFATIFRIAFAPARLLRHHFPRAVFRAHVTGAFLIFLILPIILSTEESMLARASSRDASRDLAAAVAAHNGGRADEAEKLLDGIIDRDSEDAWGKRARFLRGAHALAAGDDPEAIAWLGNLTLVGANLEDYRNWLLAQALEREGRHREAQHHLETLWARHPDFAYRSAAGLRLGAYLEEGGPAGGARARTVYRDLAESLPQGDAQAAALARLAALERESGPTLAALETYRRLVVEHPSTEAAREGAAVLARARESSPAAPAIVAAAAELRPAERLARATALLDDGHAGAALETLKDVDLEALAEYDRARLRVLRGRALLATGKQTESVAALENVPLVPAENYAEAQAALGEAYRVLASRERVERTTVKHVTKKQKVYKGKGKKRRAVIVKKRVPVVERSVDRAGLARRDELRRKGLQALERAGASKAARPATARLALQSALDWALDVDDIGAAFRVGRHMRERFPGSTFGRDRMWDIVWNRWQRGGDPEGEMMGRLAAASADFNGRRRAQYWQARGLARSGRREAAIEHYAELAATPYADYFGHHARLHLAELSAKHASARAALERLGKMREPVPPRLGELGPSSGDERFAKAAELRALGLYEHAVTELARTPIDDLPRAAVVEIAAIRIDQGRRGEAYKMLSNEFPELGTALQANVPEEVRALYYPLEFVDIIRSNAQANELDPYLVFGVIRQESAGQTDAISHAGARGLMQIMPATGRYLARRAGHENFEVGDLETPAVSVRLGTMYLREGVDYFGGNVELALAGYNAGPGRILQFWRGRGNRDLPEFIESLPFDESRIYVQRIVHHTNVYRRMYGPKAGPQSPEARARGGNRNRALAAP